MKLLTALLTLGIAAAPAAAQRADTATYKLSLLAADRALATDIVTRGAGAFLDRLAVNATVLIPDAPAYRSAAEARAPWLARYATPGTRFVHEAQHAVVGVDGVFGCVVGLTRLFVKGDKSDTPRYGRYIACWRRAGEREPWKVVGYTCTNDAPGTPVPSGTLEHPPHSARVRAAANGELHAAQDADSAFAAMSPKYGPGEAFGTWSAADAMMIGLAPKPRQGPAAIRDAFKSFPKDGVFQWAPDRALGDAAGGLAFTSGEAFNVVAGKRTNTKYITVWRLEPGGAWRFIFDSGSERP
ncbi:MAG: hypothetical protein HY084_07490 [Gemmatimonadetes bacterium]|nr:hypothetical protein [Gemmatimonadota bacterium]